MYQIKFFILISFLTQKGKKDERSEYKKHTPIALTYDQEHREADAQIFSPSSFLILCFRWKRCEAPF